MQIKLTENNWYMYIASYWEDYEITEEQYQNITSWQYKTKLEWWEFIFEINPEYEQIIKRQNIINFKKLEKQATEKRAEYITAEMLPEWTFKDLKLSKLKAEWDEIKSEYERVMSELVNKYWEWIIEELL